MAVPNATKVKFFQAGIDYLNDPIYVALGDNTTSYTFDPANHEFVSNVFDGGTTAQEMSGTGYSRQQLTTPSTNQDNTNNEGEWSADDVTWSGLDAGGSTSGDDAIQFILVYAQVGGDDTTPGDDPILAVFDDDSGTQVADLPLTTNGSDVTISWDAEGIVKIS